MKALIVILAVLAVLLCVLSWMLASYSMRIKRQSLEEARTWQAEHYDISWYDALEKEEYTVQSEDGYTLHALLLKNPEKADRYVLISHGYTDNRFGSLKYTRLYLDLGFHVILYDLRGHGENVPTFCTYSARERRDLVAMIQDSRKRYPDARTLGIHGESLGAATTVACLEFKPPVDFAVADCGFSEIESVMRRGLSGMHLPGFLTRFASAFAKLRYGYAYDDMRPIDSLRDNRIPILFLHGAADDFILPAHSQAMQKATAGYSELYLIEGAGHAASVLTAPEEYRQHVAGFLKHIGVLPE